MNCLCWRLEHTTIGPHPTTPNLILEDEKVVSQMRRIGSEQGFTVLVSNIHLTARGECEEYDEYEEWEIADFHPMLDVHEETWSLPLVTRLDGVELTRKVTITRDHLVQEEWFGGEEGREESYGVNVYNHHYDSSVMVVVPDERLTAFRTAPGFDGTHDMGHIVQIMITECRNDPGNMNLSNELYALLSAVDNMADVPRQALPKRKNAEVKSLPRFSDQTLGLVVQGALFLRSVTLFDGIINHIQDCVRVEMYTNYGKLFTPEMLLKFAPSLNGLMSRHQTITDKIKAQDRFREGFLYANNGAKHARDVLNEWSGQLIKQYLAATEPKDSSDGSTMLLFSLQRPRDEFFDLIIPWTKQWIHLSALCAYLSC
ncbi:hypothetical protein BDZ85DRAFT_89559 [Elsinoe ampelina]|uniref:Uncharacterized protein n=1 Tax=Elsinoe ampelina TaxID=302913 RepID=A0A6A6GHJ2_9PEZI|nr:hypothetical protein BDZ85DRAFT_89559 [Elsinoe ampelina]